MKRFLALVILLALAVILIPWLQPGVDAAPGHSAVFVIGRDSYVNDGRTKGMDAVLSSTMTGPASRCGF